jgi:hypothetical protein
MNTRDVTAAAKDELTDPERRLVAAAGIGRLVDLRVGVAKLNQPAKGTWDAARTVRAEVLAELLVGTRSPPGGLLRAVRLAGARITGRLDLEAVTLLCPLLLWDCYLEQPISLIEAYAPTVRLPGRHLPGLLAQRLETRGNVELDQRFTATGEVSLVGAHIGGTLSLSGATLTNPEGKALDAAGLIVDRDMFCRAGFTATGEVRLVGAHIGGQLEFDGASLTNPEGKALDADSLTVNRSMFCRGGFTATGEVNLRLVQVGGQLGIRKATLANSGGQALNLQQVRATALFLQPEKRPDGMVDLTAARVGTFVDDQETWPEKLRLRGFVYDVVHNDKVSVRGRLGWLQRNRDGYTPQPYDQLAAAYRRDGRDEAARRVLIAKQWRRRGRLNPWNWLLYGTVSYGYRTWLAALWLLLALWAGTNALDDAHQAGLLDPAKDNLGQQPTFHPLTYALDLLLPIVNLGQEGAWIPRGWAERWTWGLILAGWVLTTAVVAGLTGVLKRD